MSGSNNFLQWNPAINNQETDAQYLADTVRLNGAVSGIYTAPLHNKFAYQTSTFIKALGDSLANQGYAVSDSNLASLISVFSTLANTAGFSMTGALQQPIPVAVNIASNTVTLPTTSNRFIVSGTGPVNTITGFSGGEVEIRWNAVVTLTNSANLVLLNSGANRVTAAGDIGYYAFDGGGVIRETSYQPVNPAPLANDNGFINGLFDLWTRGTSLTAGTGVRYLADKWASNSVGSTIAPSQQAFALGQNTVPGNPKFFHRSVVASVANAANFAFLEQPIDGQTSGINGVASYAGQTVAHGFWAKADASKSIAVDLIQNFGTGGSPSTSVQGIGATKINLTTSWQFFTLTFSVPSISGKTLGTKDDYLGVRFWFDAGANYNTYTGSLGQQSGTFDIAMTKIEPGVLPTPLVRRKNELQLSQLSCELMLQNTVVGRVGAPGTICEFTWPFLVAKRGMPTITGNVNGTAINASATTTVSSTSINAITQGGIAYATTNAAASTTYSSCSNTGIAGMLAADADIYTL